MNQKKSIICVFTFFCAIAAADEKPALDLIKLPALVEPHPLIEQKDKTALTVGDAVDVRVDLSKESQSLKPTVEESMKNGPITWGDGRLLSIKEENQGSNHFFVFQVTCYRPGPCKFPGFIFSENGEARLITEEKIVDFSAVEGSGEQEEVYEPEKIPLPWKYILSVIGVVLTVLSLAYFIFKKISKKQAKDAVIEAPAPVYVDPFQELEMALADLESKKYVSSREFKKHYFPVSEALKKYVGRVYSFNAQDRTTQELKQDLQGKCPSDDLVKEWIAFFVEMDVIKFTDFPPLEEKAQSLVMRALDLAKKSRGTHAI